MATKQDAREKFLQIVRENGWKPDTTATVATSSRRLGSRDERAQDPHAFIKNAADGGTWRIDLDYSVSSGSGYFRSTRNGSTLRRLTLRYLPVGSSTETLDDGRVRLPYIDPLTNDDHSQLSRWSRHDNVLFQPSDHNKPSALYEALDREGAKPLTLRQRAELVVKDPDTAAWLAAEQRYNNDIAERKRRDAARLDEQLRARPLPVTVSTEGYASEWRKLTWKLESAAKALDRADGKSDLPQLVAEAHHALHAIDRALTREARAEALLKTAQPLGDVVELDA